MDDKVVGVLAVFGTIVGVILLVAGLSLLMAYPTMWAWNYVMPYLFGFKTLSFWQAFCVNYLAGTLIRSTQTNNNKK